MMHDEENFNVLTYGKPQGTIELRPNPKEIIEVDPRILAQMKAKLKGEDTSNLYDVSDRIIDEMTLQREKKKLLMIFSSQSQIFEAYSSIKGMSYIQQELEFEEVDLAMLSEHALVLSRGANVDVVDFLAHFLFGSKLKTKEERLKLGQEPFEIVVQDYLSNHFEPLKLTKEVIYTSPALSDLFRKKELVDRFNMFLRSFYEGKV